MEEKEIKEFWEREHRIMAIDPSLRNTGVCYRDIKTNELEQRTFKVKEKEEIVAIGRLYVIIDNLLHYQKTSLVVIEGYSYASTGSAAVTMGAVGGMLRTLAYGLAGAVLEVPPASWKKLMFGRNAKKEEHRLLAFKYYKMEFDSLDECDATMMYGLVSKGLMQNKWKFKPDEKRVKELKSSIVERLAWKAF